MDTQGNIYLMYVLRTLEFPGKEWMVWDAGDGEQCGNEVVWKDTL